MSLQHVIDSLTQDQLRGIATDLGVANDCFDKRILGQRIIGQLKLLYRDQLEEDIRKHEDVLILWRDLVYKVIDQRKCKSENNKAKYQVLRSLQNLQSLQNFDNADSMESVCRDILFLLWQESSDAEKQKFRTVVREELDKHKVKFTEREFNNAIQSSFMGGAGGVLPIIVPIISSVMLQQMTKGLLGWFTVGVLGKHAMAASVLGTLAGPVGWGLAVGSLGVGLATSTWKYQAEMKKIKFSQATLSIYSYSYQNNFNKRRGDR